MTSGIPIAQKTTGPVEPLFRPFKFGVTRLKNRVGVKKGQNYLLGLVNGSDPTGERDDSAV